jgi:hypothetical protein
MVRLKPRGFGRRPNPSGGCRINSLRERFSLYYSCTEQLGKVPTPTPVQGTYDARILYKRYRLQARDEQCIV